MAEQHGVGTARTVGTVEVREALEQAIQAGEGIVVLGVRRRGQEAVRARVAQIVWAAIWDSLALDPRDEADESEALDP